MLPGCVIYFDGMQASRHGIYLRVGYIPFAGEKVYTGGLGIYRCTHKTNGADGHSPFPHGTISAIGAAVPIGLAVFVIQANIVLGNLAQFAVDCNTQNSESHSCPEPRCLFGAAFLCLADGGPLRSPSSGAWRG